MIGWWNHGGWRLLAPPPRSLCSDVDSMTALGFSPQSKNGQGFLLHLKAFAWLLNSLLCVFFFKVAPSTCCRILMRREESIANACFTGSQCYVAMLRDLLGVTWQCRGASLQVKDHRHPHFWEWMDYAFCKGIGLLETNTLPVVSHAWICSWTFSVTSSLSGGVSAVSFWIATYDTCTRLSKHDKKHEHVLHSWAGKLLKANQCIRPTGLQMCWCMLMRCLIRSPEWPLGCLGDSVGLRRCFWYGGVWFCQVSGGLIESNQFSLRCSQLTNTAYTQLVKARIDATQPTFF